MSSFENDYLHLCRAAMLAEKYQYRNGACGTLFNTKIIHDFRYGFPLITTRKISFDIILGEFLWAIQGKTNIAELNSKIWDEFADKDGELGPIYGYQWTMWPDYDREMGKVNSYNQLELAISHLKHDINSRRVVVSAWNVPHLKFMALPPCQPMFQLYHSVRRMGPYNHSHLNMTVFARSADLVIGFPYDIGLYSLILITSAARLGLPPGKITFLMTNCHVYEQHYEQLEIQLMRKPYTLPRLLHSIIPHTKFGGIDSSRYNLENYKHRGPLKFKLVP